MPPSSASARLPAALLLSAGSDSWLQDAAKVLQGERPVQTETLAVKWLHWFLDQHDTVDAIELTAHSISCPGETRNLMKMGSWIVSANAFAADAATLKPKLKAKQCGVIRLVGCHTVLGKPAAATLRHLEQTFDIQALGTTRVVGTTDLTPNGANLSRFGLFERASKKRENQSVHVDAAALREAGATEHPLGPLSEDFFDVPPGPAHELIGSLLDAFLPRSYFELPGLLSLPDCSVLLPVAHVGSTAGVVVASSLFGGQVVRLARTDVLSPPPARLFVVPASLHTATALAFRSHRSETLRLLRSYRAT